MAEKRVYRGSGLRFALFLLVGGASLSSPASAVDPAGRREAIDAADAAAGPLKEDPSVPVCASPPASGEKLAGDMNLLGEGHSMEISNGGGGDALVNIRHADTRKLASRFYLRSGEQVVIEGVPDGSYLLQYAFGPMLAADCKTFTRIIRAREMPEPDHLKTQVIDDDEHTEVKHGTVSYELSVSEDANVKPVKIDSAAFNAE